MDYAKARPWLEMAANQNHPDANSSLGFMYDMGMGVGRSLRPAREYYLKSIKLGGKAALKQMKALTKNIKIVSTTIRSDSEVNYNKYHFASI